MKTAIILLTVLSMTITSFETIEREHNDALAEAAAERMAHQVVTALQHRSLEEYKTIFPTLGEVHAIMEYNASLYADNLAAAKDDFKIHYVHEALPALSKSFKSIIANGEKVGIDWNKIKLENVEFSKTGTSIAPATITFSCEGKEYKLQFERMLFINGEWKVSQFATLI
jgi:hypothetical protein